ncbi:hypothetical protein [Lacrimispora brassicae]
MKVRVQFYPSVREMPPCGLTYRPHFVVKGTELYFGIQFEELKEMPLGTLIDAEVRFLYTVDYSGLTVGAEFYIMEGPHKVGEGIVLS